jgi:hypothetical protein
METEMGLEVQLKRDHIVEAQVQDEEAKKRKIELDPEERELLAEAGGAAKFNRCLNEVVDEEDFTDYYASQAEQFRDLWKTLYLAPYSNFEDESEFLISPSLLFSDG